MWQHQNGKKILSTNTSLCFVNVSNEPSQRLALNGCRNYSHLSLSQETIIRVVLAVITTQQTPPRHELYLESGQFLSVTNCHTLN